MEQSKQEIQIADFMEWSSGRWLYSICILADLSIIPIQIMKGNKISHQFNQINRQKAISTKKKTNQTSRNCKKKEQGIVNSRIAEQYQSNAYSQKKMFKRSPCFHEGLQFIQDCEKECAQTAESDTEPLSGMNQKKRRIKLNSKRRYLTRSQSLKPDKSHTSQFFRGRFEKFAFRSKKYIQMENEMKSHAQHGQKTKVEEIFQLASELNHYKKMYNQVIESLGRAEQKREREKKKFQTAKHLLEQQLHILKNKINLSNSNSENVSDNIVQGEIELDSVQRPLENKLLEIRM